MSVRIQSYKTCAHDGEDEFIERKSRFIGYLSHAADEEEARAYIEMIRERCRKVVLMWNYLPAIVKAIIQTKRRSLGLDANSKKFN